MRIRAYLILMAAAILVPVIAFSTVALKMLQDAERAAALRGLHETARGISLLTDRELYSAEAALRVLASSPSLAQGNLASFYEEATVAGHGPDEWVLLLNQDGKQLINTIVPFGTQLPAPVAQERVRQVMDTQETLVSNVIPGPVTKRLLTTVNIPVPLEGGRRFVLAKAFNTDHFNRLITSAHVPEGWLVAIIDGEGSFIARSLKAEEMIGKPARPELVAAAREQASGQIRHHTLEGMEVYDVFTHSSLSGWTIAVAAPVEMIERSTRRAAMVASLGMLAAVLCAAGVAFVFSSRHVSEIERAAKAAAGLGLGRLPEPVTSRVVEVNQLHAALHAAGNQIAQAQEYRKKAEAERQALLMSERAARQMAEEQNKAKDQFLAMLGHELRNPLAPIGTAAHLLKLPGVDAQRVQYASDVITRQLKHMNSLLGDLLDVSRVTRGLVTLNMEPVDVKAAIADAVEQVRDLVQSKRQQFTIRVPEETIWIKGDKTRLIQVVANLLNKAAKYTNNEGDITLGLEAESDRIVLTVRDNGVGMTSDLLPRVFDLFSQGDRSPDRSQGGLGLGLALVKSLVELHGGSVAAHSDGAGKGSRFVLRLPRLAEPEKWMKQEEARLHVNQESLRIMIVDDNVDAAQSLAWFLREARGYSVFVHYDGRSALEQLPLEAPHVAVLDIGLPDMDGYALARCMRRVPQTRDSVLIALTGYGQTQDRKRAEEAGVDYHLSKPAEPGELLALLDDIQVAD